jgi:hypothetical protein
VLFSRPSPDPPRGLVCLLTRASKTSIAGIAAVLARCGAPSLAEERLTGFAQVLALPAFHTAQGMFQSPSPSVPDSVDPTVWTTSTMSPLLLWS